MPKISTDNYDTVASWNGSQDLFVVEQPDGTKVATPAMVKQYVLGNSIDDIYSVMGQMGAKNLIPYPYYRASGYSSNGMTTSYDSDGVLTVNKVAGSSTAFFALTYTDDNYCLKPNTKYKLVVEFDNTTQLSVFIKYGDIDMAIINKKSTGKYAANFTTPQTLEGRENIAIYATSSDTETNAKVKVMIMLASDTDNTYEPYAKTNKELTEVIGDLSQTGLTGDSVAEQLDTAREQIANRIKIIPNTGASYTCTSTNPEYTGVSVTCPAGHTYIVRAALSFSNTAPSEILVSKSNTNSNVYNRLAYAASGFVTFLLKGGETAYIWGKWGAAGTNSVSYDAVDITN